MTIHTISWARNECDILEAFVRHHAQLGPITIVLHRCRDNSSEILESLQREGLPVSFRTDERLAHEQAIVLNELMRDACQQGADWIFPLDADEFLMGDVQAQLAARGQDPTIVRVGWKGYVPLGTDSADEQNVLKRIKYRRSIENPPWYKTLIPRTAIHDQAHLGLGNHALNDKDGNMAAMISSTLTLAHFPVRSTKQIARKIFGGWLAYCADPTREQGGCFQWKTAFETLKSGRNLNTSELTTLALEYATQTQWQALPKTFTGGKQLEDVLESSTEEVKTVYDPVPHDFAIRYPIREAEPMNVLLENAEDIANAFAKLTTELAARDEVSGGARDGDEKSPAASTPRYPTQTATGNPETTLVREP